MGSLLIAVIAMAFVGLGYAVAWFEFKEQLRCERTQADMWRDKARKAREEAEANARQILQKHWEALIDPILNLLEVDNATYKMLKEEYLGSHKR